VCKCNQHDQQQRTSCTVSGPPLVWTATGCDTAALGLLIMAAIAGFGVVALIGEHLWLLIAYRYECAVAPLLIMAALVLGCLSLHCRYVRLRLVLAAHEALLQRPPDERLAHPARRRLKKPVRSSRRAGKAREKVAGKRAHEREVVVGSRRNGSAERIERAPAH
jgi:hypothetical protein